ncbi:RNA polymerase sigma factor [Candidatus Contubernalis alkalaceticus]|uniref:RNA polymerase sigma factor n=1 Tax=Candidatus Contubernalis alkaliaceticus TaxID=338645 RepID=UPI0029623A35|nr:sigma-70 family RNA polymerase sigma factor [Candidatus Contubernalis alkalaceticus]UNC91052.1 sigma-70 family RNA polymerase sigma factor [Candidatus Contubernalis alkalaceticus]
MEYNQGLYHVIQNIVKNQSLAEEILQDVFLKAIECYPTIKNNSYMGSWLYKVAVNKAFNVNKRERFFVKIPLDILELKKYCIEEDILRALSNKELRKELQSSLDILDSISFTILFLFYFEEKKLEEIGNILRIPIGTVKSRLHRAKNKLRKHITVDKKHFSRLIKDAVFF